MLSCAHWGSTLWELLFGGPFFMGLRFGGRESRATDFGSGRAPTGGIGTSLWVSRVSGNRFLIWSCTHSLGGLHSKALHCGNLHPGGLHFGSPDSQATDFGSGHALTWGLHSEGYASAVYNQEAYALGSTAAFGSGAFTVGLHYGGYTVGV